MGLLSDRSVLIIDAGLNGELAPRLAREFGEVAYWAPSITAFPQHPQSIVGAGYEGVIRVPIDQLYDAIPAADLIIFPDLYFSDLQVYLRDQGKRVWGSGKGEQLELDREQLKNYCNEQGIRTVDGYEIVTGVEDLRGYLEVDDQECFIKISKYRGDTETHHHRSWKESEFWFNDLVSHLGPLGKITEFLLEPPSEGCELGADLFTIDGQYPTKKMWGPEVKDAGYRGQVTANLAPHLQSICDGLMPWFKEKRYRNLFSIETCGKELIDLACRFPAPPSASMMENIENLGEIMWWGAEGELVEPKWQGRFATEIIAKASWTQQGHWLALDFPKKLRPWIKLKYGMKMGDTYYCIPHPSLMEEVFSVVAIADTEDEADRLALERIEQVHGDTVRFSGDVIDQAKKVIAEAQDAGLIKW